MKKFLLVLVLLAAVFYAFTTYFTVNSQSIKDGGYRVEIVNKFNGKSYILMGEK